VKLIYDFKSKGVKGKYIDAVSYYILQPCIRQISNKILLKTMLIIYTKKETTQLHKALDIFCFPRHKTHNTLQNLT